MTRRPAALMKRTRNDRYRACAHHSGDTRAERHQRQRPYFRRLGTLADGYRGRHRRIAPGKRTSGDGGDRGDEVPRAHSPARPDLGLRGGRAGRPHLDGGQDRSYRRTGFRGNRSQGHRRPVHLCRARLRPPPTGDRPSSLGCGRDLVVAFGRAGSAGPAARTARLVLRRFRLLLLRLAADGGGKHVERKTVVAAVQARPAILAVVLIVGGALFRAWPAGAAKALVALIAVGPVAAILAL